MSNELFRSLVSEGPRPCPFTGKMHLCLKTLVLTAIVAELHTMAVFHTPKNSRSRCAEASFGAGHLSLSCKPLNGLLVCDRKARQR